MSREGTTLEARAMQPYSSRLAGPGRNRNISMAASMRANTASPTPSSRPTCPPSPSVKWPAVHRANTPQPMAAVL